MSPAMIKFMDAHPELSITRKGVVYDGSWPVAPGSLEIPVPYGPKAAKLAAKANKAKWAQLFALPILGSEEEFHKTAKAACF